MSIFSFFSSSVPTPKSYEEAYNLSYELVNDYPQKALKIIKSIYNQNLPVEESNIFYVTSIASLALRPIYREIKIGKTLLLKVIAIKQNDFISNFLLFSFAISENNMTDALKYANALINADYRKHIEELGPSLSSSITEIKNSTKHVADAFHRVGNIFIEMNENAKAIKSFEIAFEIDPSFVEAHHNIGIILYKLRHYLEAIKNFEKDIVLVEAKSKEYPNNSNLEKAQNKFLSRIYFNIGKSYFRLGQLTEAKKYLGKSVALTDKNNNRNIDEGVNSLLLFLKQESEL